MAIGRKNWMFAGSDEGGRRAAVPYSIIETCKRCGVEPWSYVREMLVAVATHPASRIDELLPDLWPPAAAVVTR